MQYHSSTLTLARNSVSLHIRQWSTGNEACILIHGFGEGAYIWTDIAPSIAKSFRTLAVDLRGHGDSSWDAKGEYSVDDHVADLIEVTDLLRIQRFALVGHSLGGNIAMQIAAARPESVIGLVIVDFGPDLNPEGTDRVLTDFNDSLRTWDSLSEYAEWLQVRRPLVSPTITNNLSAGALQAHPNGGYRVKCDPALGNAKMREHDSAFLWNIIASLSSPVLILRGIGSAVLNCKVAQKMAQMLPDGHLRTISQAGHGVVLDNPREFAAAVLPFLSQLHETERSRKLPQRYHTETNMNKDGR
jgi:pimeloyl-ACP methyl ester carboxylesterase